MAAEAAPSFPPGYLEESIQPAMYGVAGLFIGLTTIAVILRFVSRRLANVGFRWDDVFVIIGYVLFIALAAACIADPMYGGSGLHTAAVEMKGGIPMLKTFFKFFLAIPILYLAAVVFPKLALLTIYLNIFTHTQKAVRIACWTIGALTIANWLATTIAGFCICMPLSYLWEQVEGAHGSCFDINSWFRWASFLNFATDVALLVIPIPVVWKIQVPISVRIGLIFTFMLGSVGLAASIVRFAGFFTVNAEADPTWASGPLIIWTIVESGMYLIACCLPTYRPLMKKVGFNVTFSTLRKSTHGKPDETLQMGNNSRGRYATKESKFSRLSGSEEDSIGLVDDKTGVPLNSIRVDQEFSVR